MGKNTSIALGNRFQSFIEKKIEEGRFGSANDAVRAGLRLLEEREAKLDLLRRALVDGEESGPAVPFDVDSFLLEMERE